MKGDKFTFVPQVVNAGGISPRVVRITDPAYACNHLYFHNRSFTPDDKKIVFESEKDGGNNLFVMDRETNEVMQLTEGYQLDYFGYPSRDGKKVFFGADGCIKAVDLETCEEEIILRAQDYVETTVTKCSGAFPSWDGKKLVCFYEANPDFGLIVKNFETGEVKIIVHGIQPVRHCQFCPNDNDLILYAHEGTWEYIKARMWLIQSDGSNNRRVRDHDDGDYEAAGHEFWANTEKALYFTVRREGKVFFSKYLVDEDKEITLFELDNEHGTITQDDKYIICDSKRGAGEMYQVKLENNEVQVMLYQKFSWAPGTSRFHPHVTVSYTTGEAIYTTDCDGKPGVYVAEIPEF
ncbi:MAG: PD40 domain-containing protein [Firmicutes bacterium]|nr:PD40 domain-containing protein [Bacillota bacterium]